MIYEIWCNGKLHYTRPEGHPDIQEALDLIERSRRLFGVSAYEVRPTLHEADLANDGPQFGATSNCVECGKRVVFCGDGVWLHCEPQNHGFARPNSAIVNPPNR